MLTNKISLIFYNWIKKIDNQVFFASILMLVIGFMLVTTTSDVIADRIGVAADYFRDRQIVYIAIGFIFIILFSSMGQKSIRRISVIMLPICIILLIACLFSTSSIKGAKRWITIFGFSLQPSEILKPFFSVVIAWLLSIKDGDKDFPAYKVSIAIYLVISLLLLKQPDFGMFVVISCIYLSQLFIFGLPFIYASIAVAVGAVSTICIYFTLPHVAYRIDSFFSGKVGYQISKAIMSFKTGGIFGLGPGEGVVKKSLPDSHTDFIFSVAIEELGAMGGTIIIFLFAFIVLRNILKLYKLKNMFKIIAVTGLVVQIAVQSIINIGVNLAVFPTKGSTLPFISYGGSSMVSVCIVVGMLLTLNTKEINSNISEVE